MSLTRFTVPTPDEYEIYSIHMRFQTMSLMPWFQLQGVRDLDKLWAEREREQDQRNAERAASWAARFKTGALSR